MTPAQKVELIQGYLARRPDLRVGIETGLWNGTGSLDKIHGLRSTIVIDIDPENCRLAEPSYSRVILGDSAVQLAKLLDLDYGGAVREPALFWLDAHKLEEYDGEDSCPLLDELRAIVAWPHASRSVVLIDDVRLLTDRASGYPTPAQVGEVIEGIGWLTESNDDVMALLTDQ